MQIAYDMHQSRLLVQLDGEIDHHSSSQVRTEIDTAVYSHLPHALVLDFRNVTFMDSSGIGLIMGRYKILQSLGGEIVLQNPSPAIARVLRLAGMERLARMQTSQPCAEETGEHAGERTQPDHSGNPEMAEIADKEIAS